LSRPLHALTPAAASARDGLPPADVADFERLAHVVLSAPSSALGPVLRAQMPGGAGVRWLGKDPAAPHDSQARRGPLQRGRTTGRVPSGGPGGERGGRPAPHGHAPGAHAIPRWK
jgi:hypothetical protein